ncbi:MAG: YdcH family protein [Alphaproteobacteria bacterium]|nr:YdcH family protein [Alphaproteobacteria bacterium]
MSLQDRIEALKTQHAALERAIDEESARPLPNQDTIHDLKRQKLRIKDEIFQLEKDGAHPAAAR